MFRPSADTITQPTRGLGSDKAMDCRAKERASSIIVVMPPSYRSSDQDRRRSSRFTQQAE
jgi:hypothetical protein